MGDQTDGSTTGGTASDPATANADATATLPLERSLAVAATGVSRMTSDVASGRLVIDLATGQKLQQAIADHISQVSGWKQQASGLGTAAPLGQNWVGQSMAQKFASRASGTDNSLNTVLDRYHSVLTDAHNAVTQSMAAYSGTNEQIVDEFHQLGRGIKTS